LSHQKSPHSGELLTRAGGSARRAFLIPRLVGVVEAGEPAADVVSVVHRLDQSVRAHGPDHGLAQL